MYLSDIQLNRSDHNGGPSLLRDQDYHSHRSCYSIHCEFQFSTEMDKEKNDVST